MSLSQLDDFIKECKKNKKCNYSHTIFKYLKDEETNATVLLNIDTQLYRSRKIENDNSYLNISENFYGYDMEGSFVPPKFAGQRVNKENVPCLYCADNSYYALIEVRPKLHDKISLATLRVNYPLRIFDLTLFHNQKDMNDEKKKLFDDLSYLFSLPVYKNSMDDYLPTQLIAEYIIKELKFDGIAYSSSLCPALNKYNYKCTNYAIFNFENIVPIKSNVVEYKAKEPLSQNYDFINFNQIDNDKDKLVLISSLTDSTGNMNYDFKFTFGSNKILRNYNEISNNNNVFVSTKNKRYNTSIKIVKLLSDDIKFYIGDSFQCFLNERNARVRFLPSKFLNDQINDFDLLFSSIEDGKFWIGDRENNSRGNFKIKIPQIYKEDVESYKKMNDFANIVKNSLLKIRIPLNVNMKDILEAEKHNISIIMECILFGKLLNLDITMFKGNYSEGIDSWRNILSSENIKKYKKYIFKIYNYNILFLEFCGVYTLLWLEETSANTYHVCDYFSKVKTVNWECEYNGIKTDVLAPHFSMLTPFQLVTMANINFYALANSYIEIDKTSKFKDMELIANEDVWNLIVAYQISKDSRFLRAADKINTWIISKSNKKLQNYPILNDFYLKKLTKRDFDKNKFKTISTSLKDPAEQAFAYVIADDYSNASKIFSTLNDDIKHRLPIKIALEEFSKIFNYN